MVVQAKGINLYLGPKGRGAPDSIRAVVTPRDASAQTWVASQQLSDTKVLGRMIEAGRGQGLCAAVLEYDYLIEQEETDPWVEGGRREPNRQALLAMLRAGWRVRFDRLSSLQHSNFVVSRSGPGSASVTLTSANLSPGSLDEHLNWAVTTDAPPYVTACIDAFEQAADGDFSQIQVSVEETPDLAGLTISSTGGTLADVGRMIEGATQTIDFAYFNVSTGSDLVRALQDATARGVTVRGVVDGDQGNQPWDAVGILQAMGVDARYYPGQLTGARGRMHYKFLVVDEVNLHFGTANQSAAARSSLELGIVVSDAATMARAVSKEFMRLYQNASPIPLRA